MSLAYKLYSLRSTFIKFIFVLCMLVTVSCNRSKMYLTKEERNWIKNRSNDIYILWGYDDAPYGYFNEEGKYVGILPDMQLEIEKQLNIKFKHKYFQTWDSIIKYTQTHNDFIVVGIAQTPRREKYLKFTSTLTRLPYIILTYSKSGINRLEDLEEKKIAAPKSYAVVEYMENKYPEIKLVEFDFIKDGIRKVVLKEFDAMILNQMNAVYTIEEQGFTNLKIVDDLNFISRLTVGVSVDNEELFAIMDKVVENIPVYRKKEIFNKHVRPNNKILTRRTILVWSVIIFIGILVLGLSWLWLIILRKQIKLKTKELLAAKERAEESDRLKSAFLANMSHEIRTPMNGILGFTELLKDAEVNVTDQKEYVNIIYESGRRLLTTVNKIIEVSKIETGQITPFIEEVDINELLDYFIHFFALEAKQKGIKIECNKCIEGEKLIIKTDKGFIHSVISNLILNALKYTFKGKVEIGYIRLDNAIKFWVRDTGIGISEDHQKSIFNRFERIKDTKKYLVEGGVGLGLSIAKSYIEMLNGEIWVESKLNEGSTFYFTHPIHL